MPQDRDHFYILHRFKFLQIGGIIFYSYVMLLTVIFPIGIV